MPMSSGARGLNLTAANNIIFVEPQMDISQIAQAIGRIDRIGQKKGNDGTSFCSLWFH
ncbi:hypothetical protein WUBG_19192 [Wuchereria bancrofti]|uniref:Helicase C-terminal domain-containing protein n=1 Tax=Wuchereria bancrofti TaxID=6293 RepID=J9DZ72_WUCBA|nr:hypothetical protein WUBG_19192 [Wuchereria bancrofti]